MKDNYPQFRPTKEVVASYVSRNFADMPNVETATVPGMAIARRVFEHRGNKVEAHLHEWVLDIDNPEEFARFVRGEQPGKFPKTDTLLVKSPRGFHYHFKGEAPTHRKAFPGADVVGATLMIIMPPSTGYTYLRNTAILEASPQLHDHVKGLPDTGYKGDKK